MGVRERAVVAQSIPTVPLFLEDFQTSHFQATEAKVKTEEGIQHQKQMERKKRERGMGDDGRGLQLRNAAKVLITDRGIGFLNIQRADDLAACICVCVWALMHVYVCVLLGCVHAYVQDCPNALHVHLVLYVHEVTAEYFTCVYLCICTFGLVDFMYLKL